MCNGDLKLDWISFTWKNDHSDIDNVVSSLENFLLVFPEFIEDISNCYLASGNGFYDSVYIFNDNVRFSFNVEEHENFKHDVGVNVSVPSHGLEWLFDRLGVDNVRDLVRLLVFRNCKLSRIDLCFDDYGMKFSPLYYAKKFDERKIKSNFLYYNYIASTRERGHTIYFGKRSNGKTLRIYDKDYESKGAIKAYRYEFELHQEYAQGAQLYFLEHDSLKFFDYLLSYFKVIELDDSNRSRCSINKEWFDYFTNSVFCEEIKIPKYTRDEKLVLVSRWIEEQCINNIRGYVEVFGWERLREKVRHAQKTKDIPIRYKQFIT